MLGYFVGFVPSMTINQYCLHRCCTHWFCVNDWGNPTFTANCRITIQLMQCISDLILVLFKIIITLFDSCYLCRHSIAHHIGTKVGSIFIISVIHPTSLGNTVLFESVVFAGGTIIESMNVKVQYILLGPSFSPNDRYYVANILLFEVDWLLNAWSHYWRGRVFQLMGCGGCP